MVVHFTVKPQNLLHMTRAIVWSTWLVPIVKRRPNLVVIVLCSLSLLAWIALVTVLHLQKLIAKL